MKNREFKTLALVGLTTGLLISGQAAQAKDNGTDSQKNEYKDPNSENMGYHIYTKQELMLELNEDGIKMFNSLSPEGQALALKVASVRCQATNQCKGLNACKTEKNDCMFKGACKGQGKCAFSNKNDAVKAVYLKMANKRAGALKN